MQHEPFDHHSVIILSSFDHFFSPRTPFFRVSLSGPPKFDFRGWLTVLYWPVSRCAKVQRPKIHQVRGEAGMGRGLRSQMEQVAEEGGVPIQIGLWTRVEEGKAVCKCNLGCVCQ